MDAAHPLSVASLSPTQNPTQIPYDSPTIPKWAHQTDATRCSVMKRPAELARSAVRLGLTEVSANPDWRRLLLSGMSNLQCLIAPNHTRGPHEQSAPSVSVAYTTARVGSRRGSTAAAPHCSVTPLLCFDDSSARKLEIRRTERRPLIEAVRRFGLAEEPGCDVELAEQISS